MTTERIPRSLTPLERYMVLDDRPGHPMMLLAHIDFDGVFREALFENAVTRTLQRYPVLRATVHGDCEWREPVPADEVGAVRWLPWSDEPPAEAFERIDISRETGSRLFMQQNAEQARLTLAFHHAAVDGTGLTRFCWDIAAAYAAEVSGPGVEPSWLPLAPESLAQPGESQPVEPVSTSSSRHAAATPPLGEIAGFLLRRPARIRASMASQATHRTASTTRAAPPVVDHTFDAAAFERIRRTAREHDASVNDVFLCAVFQAIAEWNAPATPSRNGRWLRLMVPTDLRSREDANLGAMNVLGFAFLDRRIRDCADASAMLRSIGNEMRGIRLNRVGRRILDGIAMVDRIPGLLRLILLPRVTLATVVVSNLGRIGARVPGTPGRGPDKHAASNPTITRIRGIVPLRPGTRASFALLRLRNTLNLTLRTDPQYLDREAADRLLAASVAKVNDLSRRDSSS